MSTSDRDVPKPLRGWLRLSPLLTVAVSLLAIVLSLISGAVGGFTTHLLTLDRARAEKRQELALSRLVQIWDDLEAANSNLIGSQPERLFSAISRIQLFGTQEMIDYIDATSEQTGDGPRATDAKPLLYMLRDRIRAELDLPPLRHDKYKWVSGQPIQTYFPGATSQ